MGRMIETIEYEAAGRAFSGILAAPAGGKVRGGVLVCHGGSGIADHERQQVEKLASLGFVALAPDLFGEQFVDRAHGMRVIGELVAEPSRLRDRATGALQRLVAHASVGDGNAVAIGHCFGGLAALELARSGADIRAVVSFHGRLTSAAPAQRGQVHARVLACTGAEDPFCPRDQRVAFEDEMTAAGVDWQHHIYSGALHGFTVVGLDPTKHPGCAYNELADRRSWQAMIGLLHEVIPSPA
jgi:dienelactone hydrolase